MFPARLSFLLAEASVSGGRHVRVVDTGALAWPAPPRPALSSAAPAGPPAGWEPKRSAFRAGPRRPSCRSARGPLVVTAPVARRGRVAGGGLGGAPGAFPAPRRCGQRPPACARARALRRHRLGVRVRTARPWETRPVAVGNEFRCPMPGDVK